MSEYVFERENTCYTLSACTTILDPHIRWLQSSVSYPTWHIGKEGLASLKIKPIRSVHIKDLTGVDHSSHRGSIAVENPSKATQYVEEALWWRGFLMEGKV